MIESGTRRGFLIGALVLIAAPAIVRADSLMKIMAIDVYDTRCLWDYCITTDQMVIRVDRKLGTLVRPPHAYQVPIKTARAIFGENHPIFTLRPEAGMQEFAMRAVSSHELRQNGVLPEWCQERFNA